MEKKSVYVVSASFVQWALFMVFLYVAITIVSIKEQFSADMEAQRQLFQEANKVYLEEQHNTMYGILASKLKELRISFDESNAMMEEMCAKPE